MKRRIRAYGALWKVSIMESLQFRIGTLAMLIGNLIYLVIIYNLWKAIFASVDGGIVNGMTFHDTMIYLVLASAQFNFMEAFVTWEIGRSVQSGAIVNRLLKPVSYDLYELFAVDGGNVVAFLLTFVPTFIFVQILTQGSIPMGINLVFYLMSVTIGMLINFCVDFFVGTICVYTESIWGINIMKEVVVLFLSGATIPLAFFPKPLYEFAMLLPFHSIYNTPLLFLTKEEMTISQSFVLVGEQLLWVVIMFAIARAFWYVSERQITVNGG